MTTDSDFDRRQRQAIRDSYLSYYKSDTENKNRICSISDLINGRIPDDSCQIAYTFVIGGNANGNNEFVDTDHKEALTVTPANISAVEDDVTYLNIKENMNEGKMQSWFKYATTLELDFGYVAKVDSDTMLFPPRFLSFCEESLSNRPLKEQVYGGNPIDRKSCGKRWWCERRIEGKTYMAGGLYFLSANLARYIVSPELTRNGMLAPREDVTIGNLVYSSPNPVSSIYIKDRHKLWEHGIHLKYPELYRKRWEEVKDNWLNQSQNQNTSSTDENHQTEMKGDNPTGTSKTLTLQEVEQFEGPTNFDSVDILNEESSETPNKDIEISIDHELVEEVSAMHENIPTVASKTQDPEWRDEESTEISKIVQVVEEKLSANKFPQIRFLWGIFSTEGDHVRRKMIRQTYLSTFKKTATPMRICLLNDLLENRLSKPDECQIAYTFVIGGANETNVTDLVFNSTAANRPFTVDGNGKEHDVTYLNIRENMNLGKSQSWLAYAAFLHQEDNNVSFDYVAKVDSDTLVNAPKFLEFAELTLSPNSRRIYAGVPIYKCGSKSPWTCHQLYGETYMSGELYFVSVDLAHFITTLADKPSLILPHEDVTIGNLIHEHALPIQQIPIFRSHWLWEHGEHMKYPKRFRQKWRTQQEHLERTTQWYNV
jgi:hypothetical protein